MEIEDINIVDTTTGAMIDSMTIGLVAIMMLEREVTINAMVMMMDIETINEEILVIRGIEDTGVIVVEITIDAMMGNISSLTSQDVSAIAQM